MTAIWMYAYKPSTHKLNLKLHTAAASKLSCGHKSTIVFHHCKACCMSSYIFSKLANSLRTLNTLTDWLIDWLSHMSLCLSFQQLAGPCDFTATTQSAAWWRNSLFWVIAFGESGLAAGEQEMWLTWRRHHLCSYGNLAELTLLNLWWCRSSSTTLHISLTRSTKSDCIR